MKTELEEAAKEFVLSHDFSQLTNPNHLANRCFKYGAKWQQENIIEELEMHILVNEHDWNRNPQAQFRDFVEQLKKK